MCDVVLLPLARGMLSGIRSDSRYSSLLFVTIVLAIAGSMLASNWWFSRSKRNRRWQKRTLAVAFTCQPPTLRVAPVLKLVVAIRLCRTVSRSHAVTVHNTANITYMLMCHRK